MGAPIPVYDPEAVLLPYQQVLVNDASPLILFEKTRRSGVTWGQAAKATLKASMKKSAGGRNHFYVGSNKEMAVEFIEACAMWAKAYDKACGDVEEEVFEDEDKDILTYTIRFASGFKVQALSSNPSNMRGRQGDVTIDEAAFHDKLAEVLKAALALTMWGAQVTLISTHNGIENLFNELIEDSRAGKKDYNVHRLTLDDACEQGLFKRICQINRQAWTQSAEDAWKAALMRATATKEDAEEEYYCVPKSGGGAYMSRALIESRMDASIPVIRYEGTEAFNALPVADRKKEIADWCEETLKPLLAKLDVKQVHALGEDFARNGDLTVLTPLEVDKKLKRKVPFVVELGNVPFNQQKQILFYILDRLPNFYAAALDARGNGQNLAEDAHDRYGERIIQVMITQGFYLENMPKLKAVFEDDEIVTAKDRDHLDDLRSIQVVKGVPRIPESSTNTNKSRKRHGDFAISLLMAIFASLQDIEIFEYESVAKKQKNGDQHDRPIKTTNGYGASSTGAL